MFQYEKQLKGELQALVTEAQGLSQAEAMARLDALMATYELARQEELSGLSHRLRSPLASVSGALNVLARVLPQPRPESAERMLALAVDSTRRLAEMLEVLDGAAEPSEKAEEAG